MGTQRHPTTIPPESIRPAIYLRVSSGDHATRSLGLAAQRAHGEAQCMAKGWPAPLIYADDGIPGTLAPGPKRPGLATLLADVRRGLVNAVVVLDLARLARSVTLITALIEVLDAAGATVVSCHEDFDTSTPTGQAMLRIVAVLGQIERERTGAHALADLIERDTPTGDDTGSLPYGYWRPPGQAQIAIDTPAASVVRAIFAQHAAGARMRAIAATQTGPSPYGAGWHARTIKTILDHAPYYRGEVEDWPAILD